MKRLAVLLFLTALLAMPVSAADNLSDALDTSSLSGELPAEASQAVRGLSPDGEGTLEGGISNLLGQISGLLGGAVGESLKTAALMVCVALLVGMAGSLAQGSAEQYVTLAGVMGIAAIAVTSLGGFVDTARRALEQTYGYSKILLPSLAAAAAASGRPASAVARQAMTALFADGLITLYDKLLFPLLYVYAALLTLQAALSRDVVKRLAGLIKWLVGGILGLSLTAFTIYLTISGSISGQTDAAAMKSAKVALSGMVPVVGGIIGDASEAVIVGAGVLKNSIGLFGLFAVLGIVAGPCVGLGVRYIVFKLTAALTGSLCDEKLSGYVDGLSSLFSMLLGMVAACCFLFCASIVSCIQAGGGG